MFAKQYKLKSNNTLKNSEKKHLGQRILSGFPSATEEKIKALVPVKSNSSCMKIVLHSGDAVGVYVVDGLPMIIDLGDTLVPTVCALWKVPDLVPTISIHTLVLSKIQGGAPLYAPGVVPDSITQFRRGTVIGVCTADNAAAGVVGLAGMSSADLLTAPMGVCLETLHVYGDLLCKDPKFSKIERPKLGVPSYHDMVSITTDLNQLNIQPIREEWPSLVKEEFPAVNKPKIIPEMEVVESEFNNEEDHDQLNDTVATESSETDEIPTDMDGLLRWCLLSFLKVEGKNLELPLKTNLLYKNHLMPYCPSDRALDVKKSSFKKMGKFLEAMQREGLIQVREIDKGVDALVAAELAHPLVRSHRAVAVEREPEEAATEYVPPQIRELYCITAGVVDLFAPLKKGTPLSASEVRNTLTQYVKAHELTAPNKKGAVCLDALLAKATGKQLQMSKNTEEIMKWEELTTSVLSRMTPSTEMRFADGSVKLAKSRLEPIKMQVAMRSGNKKVTLVSNLESYGFSLPPLAHECQLRVGASCGVTRSAAAKADQLMLQGDQTHFVAKLLIEKFGLPKKFIEGADKALNKKK